jgi:hypothetical protein
LQLALSSDEVIVHPEHDLALAHVPMLAELAGAEPLLVFEDDISEAWVGTPIQLAGYGESGRGRARQLGFVATVVDSLSASELVTNGAGVSGTCTGDSGGPLLAWGPDGRPRVLGILASGASSCTSFDCYTRLDIVSEWISRIAGVPEEEWEGCGSLTAVGLCQANVALFCQGAASQAMRCGAETDCGWDIRPDGYRCVPRDTSPCAGSRAYGACIDERLAERCDEGVREQVDCSGCGIRCGLHPEDGHADCVVAESR